MSTKTGARPMKTGVCATKAQRTQPSSSAPESARRVRVSHADDVGAGSNNADELSSPGPASETAEDEPEWMRVPFGHRVAAMTTEQAKAAYERAAARTKAVYEQSVAAFKAEIKADIARHQAATSAAIEGLRTEIRERFADAAGVRRARDRCSLRSPRRSRSRSWSPTRPSSPAPVPQSDTSQPVHPHQSEPADTPLQTLDLEQPKQQARAFQQPPSQFKQQYAELAQHYRELYQLAYRQQQRINELAGQCQLAPVPLASLSTQPASPVPQAQYPQQELLPSGQPAPSYQDFLDYLYQLQQQQQPYQPDSGPLSSRKRRAP